MIAAVCWVPRGAAKPHPEVVEPPSLEELQSLNPSSPTSISSDDELPDDDGDAKSMEQEEPVAKALLAASRASGSHSQEQQRINQAADELAELNMDNYDEENEGPELFGNGGVGGAYYPSNDMDPYLNGRESDDDEEEIEDMTIKESDLIILTARNEDDVSHLEMWIYEEETEDEQSNMYVHHDIMLPAFPLSVAWLDCNPKGIEKGNFVAVGTMQPEIEIWDLDLLDAVEPAVILGGPAQQSPLKACSKKKSKKNKEKTRGVKLKEGSHSDAVISLSWNNEYRNVLASGSADFSVKVWDIVCQKCEHTILCHSDKVQAVAWNPSEPTVLLSGSFDHTVSLLDMRAPAHKGIKWLLKADVESLAWDPHAAHSFVVSMEDGTVCNYDIRSVSNGGSYTGPGSGGKAVFTIHAHEKAVCTVSYNLAAPNLLATGSLDKLVKLWDIKENQPTCIASKNRKVGAVFAADFCKDAPFLLALGGSKGNLEVWEIMTETEVLRRFGKFTSQGLRPKKRCKCVTLKP